MQDRFDISTMPSSYYDWLLSLSLLESCARGILTGFWTPGGESPKAAEPDEASLGNTLLLLFLLNPGGQRVRAMLCHFQDRKGFHRYIEIDIPTRSYRFPAPYRPRFYDPKSFTPSMAAIYETTEFQLTSIEDGIAQYREP